MNEAIITLGSVLIVLGLGLIVYINIDEKLKKHKH